MYVDLETLRQQYADLSDEALLAIRRDELVDEAQQCYDAELKRRNIIHAEARVPVVVEDDPSEPPDWLEDAAEVYSSLVLPQSTAAQDAEAARDALIHAGIPCYVQFIDLEGDAADTSHQYSVLVPSRYSMRALAVVECEIYNPDFEAEYRARLEQAPDEDLAEMDPAVALGGLYDRIDRATRAYSEELARRGAANS